MAPSSQGTAGEAHKFLGAQPQPFTGHNVFHKGVPATWPHAHAYVGSHDQGIEVASLSLERTVTPEAHTYFRRIVQVTQSELEKLLVYKIQQLFDPVPAPVSAETVLEELGTKMSQRMQLPGASMYAHLADVEGSLPFAGPGRPRKGLKEKAVQEGKDLTKYLVGVVGRILADFGRFADTVLRWEQHDVKGHGLLLPGAGSREPTAKPGISAEDLVERLERQDRQNTALEAKYNSVSSELRENRRAFMRERLVWREQLFRLKTLLKRSKCKDKAILEFLEHDVQFFDGSEHTKEPSLEEVREQYELRIQQLTEEYEDKIHALEQELEMARNKLQELQELHRRRNTKGSDSLASVASLLAEREDLKDSIASLSDERDCLKDRVEELEAEKLKILEQSNALRLEVERLRMRLEDKGGSVVITKEVETRVEVEVEVEAPAADPAPAPDLPERVDRAIQASTRSWSGSLTYQAPQELTVSILPEASGVDDLQAELQALRLKVQQLEASRAEDAERYREAMRRLAEAEAEAEEATRRARRLSKQLQETSMKLADARAELGRSPPETPTRDRWTETEPWTPLSPISAMSDLNDLKEAELQRLVQSLREENAELRKRLDDAEALIKDAAEAQARINTLKAELAEARRQLEILLGPDREMQQKEAKPVRAGGFNWDKLRKMTHLASSLSDRSPEPLSPSAVSSRSPEPRKKSSQSPEPRKKPSRSPEPRKTHSRSPDSRVLSPESHKSPSRSPEPRAPTEPSEPSEPTELPERSRRTRRPSDGYSRHRPQGYALNYKPPMAGDAAAPSRAVPHAANSGSAGTDARGRPANSDGTSATAAGATASATAASTAASGRDSSVDWRALAGINMPVSGHCSATSSRPASAGLLSPEVRASYGGGFSVLLELQKAESENINPAPAEARTSSPARDDNRTSADGSTGAGAGEERRRRPRTADRGRGMAQGAAFLGRRPSDSSQLRQSHSTPHLADDSQSAGVEGDASTASAMPARAVLSQAQYEHGDRRDPSTRPPLVSGSTSSAANASGGLGTAGGAAHQPGTASSNAGIGAASGRRGLPRATSAPGGALPRGRPRSALGRVPGPWVNRLPPTGAHASGSQASSAQHLPEVRRPPRPAAGGARH